MWEAGDLLKELLPVRDEGSLDKGSSSWIGSKGTVFVDWVDIRYESKSAFRMTPNYLAWANGSMEFPSTKMCKSKSEENLEQIKDLVLDKRNQSHLLDIQVKLSSK